MKNNNESFLKRAGWGAFALLVICIIALGFLTYFVDSHDASTNPFLFIGILIVVEIVSTGCIILVWYSRTTLNENRLLTTRDWKSLDPGYYPRQGELEISIAFERAIQLSKLAVLLLPSAKLIDEDPDAGTIHASSETLSAGISMIMFTLEKKGMDSTRIQIQSAYSEGHAGYGTFHGRYTKVDNGQNEQIIATLSNYILEQSRQRMQEENPFFKDPQKAALLSLIIPGLGQAYNGRYDEGIEIALGTGMCLMFYIVPGVLFWTYGVGNAYITSRKMNSEVIPYRHAMSFGMVLVGVFSLVCLAAAYHVIAIFGPPGLVTIGRVFLGRT
jgi:TM2 domain-containing membrane protein YozV